MTGSPKQALWRNRNIKPRHYAGRIFRLMAMCNHSSACRRLTDVSCLQSRSQSKFRPVPISGLLYFQCIVLFFIGVLRRTATACRQYAGTAHMQGALLQDIRLQQTATQALVQLACNTPGNYVLVFQFIPQPKAFVILSFFNDGPNRALLLCCNESPGADMTKIYHSQQNSTTLKMIVESMEGVP